jgi:hypothetical protein
MRYLVGLTTDHVRTRSLQAGCWPGVATSRSLCEKLYSFAGESWEQEHDTTLLTLRRFGHRSRTSENSILARSPLSRARAPNH